MVADDMPKSELGGYGAAGDLTPRLDALARDAVRFDAAHSPSPLCTPARYSLLTGRHAGCAFAPSTRRVRQLSLNGTMRELPELANIEFNVNLPALATKPAHATVAQLLAQHGIPSGLVGKWHLGYSPSTVNSSERTFVQSARMPRQWNAVKPLVLREYKSLQAHVRAAGFAFVERLYVNNLYPEQHVLPAEMLRHNVEWIAEGASKFVESHRGAPFFLYVGWTLPHNPDVGESIDAGVSRGREILSAFESLSAKLSEDLSPEEMESTLAELERTQEAIDAADLWELDRVVDRAMQALRPDIFGEYHCCNDIPLERVEEMQEAWRRNASTSRPPGQLLHRVRGKLGRLSVGR